jgi:tetratricopeptide (TPR) repeat protein
MMAIKFPSAWAKHLKTMQKPKLAAAAPKHTEQIGLALRQGIILQQQRQFLDAERIYQRVLTKMPDHPEALHLMGTLALEAEDPNVAIEYFEKSVKEKPRDPFFHYNLGNTHLDVGNFEDALKHLRKASELKPNLVEALCGMGRAYVKLSKAELALPFYDRAQALDANHPMVRVGRANALINLGRMDEAVVLLNEAICRNTGVVAALGALVSTRKFFGTPPELDTVLRELTNPNNTLAENSQLHHAAGKILNDINRYDEAMDHFEKAKTISGRAFNINTYAKWVDNIIELFNPYLILEKREFGSPSDVPVFIVGMPRSGTTLTEQIASSHPDIHGAGEIYKLRQLATSIGFNPRNSNFFKDAVLAMTADKSKALAGDYLDHLKRHSRSALRIIDKMPHNFELIGFIGLIFPNARIIHCRRDPIDNCVSCFVNEFSETHGYNADLHNLGLYYREYDRLMRHWNRLLPGRIYENRYENMIADQEGETRRLIDFLGVPWNDACLNFHENARTVNTISRWQVRQPIYNSSIKRWKNYGAKLGPLIHALGNLADL